MGAKSGENDKEDVGEDAGNSDLQHFIDYGIIDGDFILEGFRWMPTKS